MRQSRFSEEKMVKVLREADATSVAKSAKNYGISEQTIYTWRKRYAGVAQQNPRSARIVADFSVRRGKVHARTRRSPRSTALGRRSAVHSGRIHSPLAPARFRRPLR